MHVDINCWIGRWPFQQRGDWTIDAVAKQLSNAGIAAACVASLEGILLPDLASAELQLADQLSSMEPIEDFEFIHTPVICDSSARWQSDLDNACNRLQARIIRLAPNYRPRGFDASHLASIIKSANSIGLRVALAVRLEDGRTQSPLLNVSAIKVEQIRSLVELIAPIPLILLNAYSSELRALSELASDNLLLFDTAMLDGPSPLQNALALTPATALVFGTSAPLLHAAAAVAKLSYSELSPGDLRRVSRDNAMGIMA